jgi:hypothetical protein
MGKSTGARVLGSFFAGSIFSLAVSQIKTPAHWYYVTAIATSVIIVLLLAWLHDSKELKHDILNSLVNGASILPNDFAYQKMALSVEHADEVFLITRMRYDLDKGIPLGATSDAEKQHLDAYYDALSTLIYDDKKQFTRYIQIDEQDIEHNWPLVVASSDRFSNELAIVYGNGFRKSSHFYVAASRIDMSMLIVNRKEVYFNFFVLDDDGRYRSSFMFYAKDEKGRVQDDIQHSFQQLGANHCKTKHDFPCLRLRHEEYQLIQESHASIKLKRERKDT